MKKIIAVLILISSPVFSANEYFRSIATGDWNTLSTWEMSVNNTVWIPATTTPISTSNIITIRNSHIVTVTANVSADQFTIDSGGTMSINPGVTFTLLNGAVTDLTVNNTGTVSGSGIFQTQGSVLMNLRNGSAFLAALKVNTGTATVSDLTTPFNGKLYGPVTIDAGATLSSNTSSSYTLFIYGNITNNGTITGTGISNKIKFLGSSFINSGSVTSPVFRFDSVCSVSGAGTYTGADIIVGHSGNVSLLNDVAFSHSSEFIIDTNGILSANSQILTLDDSDLEILSGGTVINSGTVRAADRVNIRPRDGSFFNADLNVTSGSQTWVYNSTGTNVSNAYGNITVDSGGELSTGNLTEYKLHPHGNIINNGLIYHAGSLEFPSGTHSLQGTGTWTTKATVLSGAVVNLISDHKFLSLDIKTGGTFNISNRKASFTTTNPITQNGTFITTGSTIEYNGTTLQNISTTNITYAGLRINNPSGTSLITDLTVNDTLSLVLGDLDLVVRILTLSSTGFLIETPGNTVKGNLTGYITTTRTLNAPAALNVGGLGAVITSAANLGSTVIRRGHKFQNGLNGGTSIRRYYDIIPTNNTGLNASLILRFDDSELNGKPKPSLKLFKSTNSGTNWSFEGGSVNISTNEITLLGISSFSRWSADSSKVSAAISMIMEGFYNISTNNLNMSDTVRAYFRNTTAPYAIVDSAIGIIDSLTFRSALQFNNATSGTYYLQLKHRNSLETWSKNGVNYIQDSTLNYDFTFAASRAFGDNEVQKGSKFCLYSGDVNQDGLIDLTDVISINNASSSFATGYLVTDVNGNGLVDLSDVVITNNNSNGFVKRKTPLNP